MRGEVLRDYWRRENKRNGSLRWEKDVHVDRLPSERGDPLRMTPQRITYRLPCLGIPKSGVSIMASTCQYPFHWLPFDTQNPPFVARKGV